MLQARKLLPKKALAAAHYFITPIKSADSAPESTYFRRHTILCVPAAALVMRVSSRRHAASHNTISAGLQRFIV